MKNILVIGGSGFIGSHLVEKLCLQGYNVSVLVRKDSDISFLKTLNINLRLGDLLDLESLKNVLPGIDTVFCLANVKPHGKSAAEYKKQLYLVHIEGTENLVNACKITNVKRLIYLSSVAAIGYKKGISIYDESSETYPVDDYGKVKLEAENILKRSIKNKELDITILRPPGVFGERGLGPLGKIIFFAERGIIPIIGSGRNKQSLAYAGNIANAVIRVAENPASIGRTYIISDGRPYSVNELVEAVAKAMNIHPFRMHIPVCFIHYGIGIFNFIGSMLFKKELINKESIIAISNERIFDASKIFKETGYAQEYDLASGVKRTVDWYKKNKNA